jgi:hypothetical protein
MTTKAQLEALDNTNQIAYAINTLRTKQGLKPNAYIQKDGTLRLVTKSVAEASILITRAETALSNTLDYEVRFTAKQYEVRFFKTNLIGTYPTNFSRNSFAYEEIDCGTGAVIEGTSDELIRGYRYQCACCGQQPLQHTSRCKDNSAYIVFAK